MAHLKCYHKRRVMVIPHPRAEEVGKVLHRQDGSACNTDQVRLGDKLFEPWDLLKWRQSFDAWKSLGDLPYDQAEQAADRGLERSWGNLKWNTEAETDDRH